MKPSTMLRTATLAALGTLMLAGAPAGAAALADKASVQFDVYMPLQHEDDLDALLAQLHDPASPNFRHWLTPEQFHARFGPSATDIASVAAAFKARGFTVVETNAHGLRVAGTADAVRTHLGATLETRTDAHGHTSLISKRELVLPAEIASKGAHVIAFEPLPHHRTHAKVLGKLPENRYGPDGSYWADDLKQAYDFPSYRTVSGTGQTIAIVMASDFLDADMQAYFSHENLAVPNIVRVPVCVNNVCGAPWNVNNGASFEVTLDLQQSGGMAPNATLQLYNIPDLSDTSIMAAYQQIVDSNSADIVSSSFGLFEKAYLPNYNGGTSFVYVLQQYEAIYKQGNAEGITFVASSGDSGGLGAVSIPYLYGLPGKFVAGVDTPAASPNVTAVGGTNLVTTAVSGSLESKYVSENANGDPEVPYDPYGFGVNVTGGYWGSGGGTSVIFPKPAYQYRIPTGATMRAIPDISLQMGGCPGGLSQLPCPLDGTDRSSSVLAFAYGTSSQGLYGVIGTSVSAPGFAGLLALYEEYLGHQRLGNVNTLIYQRAQLQAKTGLPIFRQNIPGFNGLDYSGGGGYNQVLGVGTPDVRLFMLAKVPAAGDPQTPSNP